MVKLHKAWVILVKKKKEAWDKCLHFENWNIFGYSETNLVSTDSFFFVCVFLLKYNGEKSLWGQVFMNIKKKLMAVSEKVPSFSGEPVVHVTTDVLYTLTSPESLSESYAENRIFFLYQHIHTKGAYCGKGFILKTFYQRWSACK